MKKRCFALILAIGFIMAMLSAAAFAETFETTATHTHPICGSRCGCTSTTHSNLTWTAWDGTTKMYTGNYYLTQDVVLSSTMILNYSHSTRLCLNGHSITCEDRVFDIYSYRTLTITDCVGTGKIESTNGWDTISNNKQLNIWGGSIINSADYGIAISAYHGTYTNIYNGVIEGYWTIDASQGCNINIQGGTIRASGGAIAGTGDLSSNITKVNISGGTIYGDVQVWPGSLTMTGGYVDGFVDVAGDNGIITSTTISGGTIAGNLYSSSNEISINGGTIGSSSWHSSLSGNTTISAGTFGGSWTFSGESTTVTGGDFSDCSVISIADDTWICGGSYSTVFAQAPLYLSGVPEIEELGVWSPSQVSAKNRDGTGSYGGDPIPVSLRYNSSTDWKDGDVVIKNVTSDAVAEKFILTGSETERMCLERSGTDLVLRFIPHVHDGLTLDREWTSTNSIPTATGNYVLQNDITLSGSGTISVSGDVSICLNGHRVNLASKYINVPSGRSLNICDCAETAGSITASSYYVIYNAGKLTLSDGTMKNTSSSGAGVQNDGYSASEAEFTMTGGSVIGGSYGYGINHYTYSTAYISGGTVSGGYSAVYVSGGSQRRSQLHISGGAFQVTRSSNPALNLAYDVDCYLTGAPMMVEHIRLNIRASLYAADGTMVYAGDSVNVTVSSPSVGKVVVHQVTDANKDSFALLDNAGYILVQNGDDLVLALEHTHAWSSEWSFDEYSHWHSCSGCEEKEAEGAHRWTEATCTAARNCEICGAADGEPLGHDPDGIMVICGAEEYTRCTRCGCWITKTGEMLEQLPSGMAPRDIFISINHSDVYQIFTAAYGEDGRMIECRSAARIFTLADVAGAAGYRVFFLDQHHVPVLEPILLMVTCQ